MFARFVLVILTSAAVVRGDEKVNFNRDIRPILSDTCFQCHGPDKNQRKADLRLDIRDEALASDAFVPGKPEQSGIIDRIFSDDPEQLMPPPKSNKVLTPEQKELFKRWVAEGAEYQGHWAYLPPVKAQIPAGMKGIDYLVGQELAERKLAPAPEADRRTLARRVSLDLIGLPPAAAEVEAFVNDPAADAYEKYVEKLLASPHYGERLAIEWLDVVRFADTIGYHSDTPRNVWPYRDYVIRAFNTNKPFDKFTVEQLAGDLLPGSTEEQKVASCFNRLLLTTEEGGAQAKDYEARMMGDRVRAVGTVWLGQTLGCCQCHDHKFDPATAQDFYAMGAFFADIQEAIIGGREPGMLVPTAEQTVELARLQSVATGLQQQFDATTPDLRAAEEAWDKLARAELPLYDGWTPLHPESVTSEKGVQFRIEADESVFADRNPQGGSDTYRVVMKTKLKEINGLRLDVLSQPTLPAQGPGRAANGNLVLSEIRVTTGDNVPVPLAGASASFEQAGLPAAAAVDGLVEAANGWAVGGGAGREHTLVVEFAAPVGSGDETTLTVTLVQNRGDNHTVGRFRCLATTAAKPVRAPQISLPPKDVVDIVKLDPEQRAPAQKARLTAWFKSMTPVLAELRGQIETARKSATDYEGTLPRCLVSVAGGLRTVRILPRGNWLDESGPIVQPALPQFLAGGFAGPADGRRLNRLDLAQWIVARENPVTARVFVNRLWKQYFGVGLCKTLDDLGSQGEWPVYPELLDWLACEFMDSGWDVKHMVREIVLSRTYRQSSLASPELLARDPENRLLARQSRYRLEAELIRDNALAVSGLLVPKIGGPSVKPYQPDGYWENLNFPVRQYQASVADDQYRRGLYTWWQRSFVHPSMLAFDAPTREECAADRTRSNIPQQALVLLNDPSYVEAARAFAARVLREGGGDVDARITWAWRQALQRDPRDSERKTVASLVAKHQAEFALAPQTAEALLKVGFAPAPADLNPAELAAWTSVARVLLNLHETVTRN